jgi:predicted ArsR family transcriptional regulator
MGRPAAPGLLPTSSPTRAGRRWVSGSGPSGGLAGSAPSAPSRWPELLAACGYAPARSATQRQLLLRNCPFQQLARRAPELVCRLNQDFLAGLLAGLRASRIEAVLQPDPTRCCVLLQAPAP